MSERKKNGTLPENITAAAGRLNKPAQTSSCEELLEENRLLREEVYASRKAAKITANLVVEQIAKMEENYHELAKVNRELHEAMDEIRTLRGTLPICANCKRIRDDTGYWNRIEQYITEHSDADFTHGLCPKCEEELYGGEEWFRDWKKEREQ